MAKFTTLPIAYPPVEQVDLSGAVVRREDTFRWTQGWIQTLSIISGIMNGVWARRENIFTNPEIVEQNLNITPYSSIMHFKLKPISSELVLEFEITSNGVVQQYDLSGVLIRNIIVNGRTITIPITAQESILSGSVLGVP